MPYWKVDERGIKDAVENSMPDGWNLQVFRVIHRKDRFTATVHWIQRMVRPASIAMIDELEAGTAQGYPRQEITLCDCRGHKFFHPLVILGIEGHDCAHIKALRAAPKHE